MQQARKKRLRWDRIGSVLAVIVLATFGIEAMIPESSKVEDGMSEGQVKFTLRSSEVHPDSVSGPSADPVPMEAEGSVDLVVEPSQPVVEVGPVQKSQFPIPGVAPCACSGGTMDLDRNPYTAHQKRARTLPGSFFREDPK